MTRRKRWKSDFTDSRGGVPIRIRVGQLKGIRAVGDDRPPGDEHRNSRTPNGDTSCVEFRTVIESAPCHPRLPRHAPRFSLVSSLGGGRRRRPGRISTILSSPNNFTANEPRTIDASRALGASPGKLHAPPCYVVIANDWPTNKHRCVGGTRREVARERVRGGGETERGRERRGEVGGTRRNPIGPTPGGYRGHRNSEEKREREREGGREIARLFRNKRIL